MLFRLADRLHKTVAEIEQLSYGELTEWMAYFQIVKREQG